MSGRLYDLGQFPGAVFDADAATLVHGEVLQLAADATLLKQLDEYEGYNPDSPAASLFVRERQLIALPDGKSLPCWVYLYNRDPASAQLIATGNYSQWHRDNGK